MTCSINGLVLLPNQTFGQSYCKVSLRHFQRGSDNGLCDYAGNEWAFIVLVSDGISSVLSDQEIVDLARDAPDPKSAANRVLSFSQDLGGDDNATAIVIPLAGWGTPYELDSTKELREYRLRQAGKYIRILDCITILTGRFQLGVNDKRECNLFFD